MGIRDLRIGLYLARSGIANKDIQALRHGSHVAGIDAGTISTDVVNHQALWNSADKSNIGFSVRSVPAVVQPKRPGPASIIAVFLLKLKEARKERVRLGLFHTADCMLSATIRQA